MSLCGRDTAQERASGRCPQSSKTPAALDALLISRARATPGCAFASRGACGSRPAAVSSFDDGGPAS